MPNLLGFMKSVQNRRTAEKKANEEGEKKKELRARTSRVSFIPKIVLIVANLILITLDVRVYDVVYKITDNVMLSIFALVPTGAMFILWYDVLYSNYPLATVWQKRIALAGAGLSLFTASVFAIMDYEFEISSGTSITGSVQFALWSSVIVSVVHMLTLFAWHSIDEEVKADHEDQKDMATQRRKAESEQAQARITLEMIETANEVLSAMEGAMKRKQTLEDVYGKAEVENMLAALAGVEIATGKDLDGNGVVGTVDANVNRYQADAEAAPTLAPVNPTTVNSPKQK